MNKKLTNILRTNVTLYFICLVLFALAAIPFDVRLAIGEGAAAVVLVALAVLIWLGSRQGPRGRRGGRRVASRR